MDMFISISDLPDKGSLIHHYDNPYMPKSVNNPYYIVEIHEPDREILNRIRQLLPLIEKQFGKSDEYLLEATSTGFKFKKRISHALYNQDSWDSWNDFSKSLYNEIAKAVGLQVDN